MSSNTRVTDLEPANVDSAAPVYVRDEKLVEIVQNGVNKSATVKQIRNAIIDDIYPVGTIYQTLDATNPGKLFPGTTWRRYGHSLADASGQNTGAAAALFGYKAGDSRFTVSETIRGLDTSAINDKAIDWRKHWGWKRLKIGNFVAHTHSGKDSKTEWKYYDDEKKDFESVDSIDLSVRGGYGLLSSLPPVINNIIAKRNLGTTTTNILADPRVAEVKIGTKTVTADPNESQYVTYTDVSDNTKTTQYIYVAVSEMKSKNATDKDGKLKDSLGNVYTINGGTKKVNKWLKKQIEPGSSKSRYLGKIAIPDTKASSTSVKYAAYNPVANPVTSRKAKGGPQYVRVKSGNGYKDVAVNGIGDYVEYTDSTGATINLVYSTDMEVYEKTEKGKTTKTVKIINKWIPYHDIWQERYWGRSGTDIRTNANKTTTKITLKQQKNNTDPTLGYYGTPVSTTISAHINDIVSCGYGEYSFKPQKYDTAVQGQTTGYVTDYTIKTINRNEWTREDSGISEVSNVPEEQKEVIGGDTVLDNVRPEMAETTSNKISQIEFSRHGHESNYYSNGSALRLVGNTTSSVQNIGYGIVLWPREVTGFTTEQMNSIKNAVVSVRTASEACQPYSTIRNCINNLRSIISSCIADRNSRQVSTSYKTTYSPEYPSDATARQEWRSHDVDNWQLLKEIHNRDISNIKSGNLLTDDLSHSTYGTIVETLPPYVTVHRWVRTA